MTDARASFILPPSAFILFEDGIGSSPPRRISSRAHRDCESIAPGLFYCAATVRLQRPVSFYHEDHEDYKTEGFEYYFVLFVPFVVQKCGIKRRYQQ